VTDRELTEAEVRALADASGDRMELWTSFLQARGVRTAAEVGVYRGAFAERMLTECPDLERYYLLDPWRHLDDWNKPANKSDDVFEGFFQETMTRTEAQAGKRVVLRGMTTEVVEQIPDGSLDFVYIDGDHTLRGITTDLARFYPKVREGGFLAGDDFCRNVFQHPGFEPTLVFPYAVYFAEAMGLRLFALPHKQFVMQKVPPGEHAFVDVAGGYDLTTLLQQIRRRDKRLAKRRADGPGAPAAAGRRTPSGLAQSVARRLRGR
jgi:hypothetical protein